MECGPKPSCDSCNFNSPGSERAFPSKLVELGQPTPPSKPIPIDQADATRSENLPASWNNTSQPAQAAPTPSPRHGPVNAMPPRRDSESSGTFRI